MREKSPFVWKLGHLRSREGVSTVCVSKSLGIYRKSKILIEKSNKHLILNLSRSQRWFIENSDKYPVCPKMDWNNSNLFELNQIKIRINFLKVFV